MSPLDRYRQKRRFDRTPEPPPEKGRRRRRKAGAPRFVIQKHDARRLHWDLRLEIDGALVSWAVPRGPSLDPKERRLAVRTEDHPLSYADFEGAIPAGEHGAGEVIVWDEGTFVPEGDPAADLAKGHLRFTLDGVRLRGAWTLVRTGGGDKEQWFLIKRRDAHAVEGDGDRIVREHPGSVRTGRTVEQIGEDEALIRHVERLPGAVRGEVPWPLVPHVPVDGPPVTGDGWLHEIKWDGYRLLARLDHGKVQLRTRGGHDWTARLGPIEAAVRALPKASLILDGELVVLGPDGRSDFGRLQRALGRKGADPGLSYLVFDVIAAAGFDLRAVPLRERKALLRELVPGEGRLRRVDAWEADATEVLDRACALGLEGIVSKRADGPYRREHHPDWIKTKCHGREEFVVGGWCRREGRLASLLLGTRRDGALRYVGRVGSGIGQEDRRTLRRLLDARRTDTCPFEGPVDEEGAVWVRPDLLVEVRFTGWTTDGRLRHPVFLGVREDKPVAPLPLGKVLLTHPDRVLFPDVGVTKRELLLHYARVAHLALPELAHRELTVVRCPNGIDRPCFYQKHLHHLPDAVRRIPPPRGAKDAEATFYVADAEGLFALVQHGGIEFHPAGARVDRPDRPDRVVFDLDPDESLAFEDTVRAAHDLRARLEALGLASWPRTTGGKGLHVVVPIERRATWDEVRDFARGVAEAMARDEPDRFVAVVTKRRRTGRILVDWLRNTPKATAVGSWVVRARPGAPVAVPLTWDDLDRLPEGGFTLRTLEVPATDPWADLAGTRQRLIRAVLDAVRPR